MRAIAAHLGSSIAGIVEMPEPHALGPAEVLCETLELGICGTDREILASGSPWVPRESSFLVLGHECLARVIEVGTNVAGFQPGDLVVPYVRRARGEARHRVDLLAWGEFTERGIVEEHGFSLPQWRDRPEYLVRVTPELKSAAVFTEPLAVAEKGCNEALALQQGRLGAEAWESDRPRVLVTGLGPIAFAALMAAQCRGWPADVVGRDAPESFRAGLVRALGGAYHTFPEIAVKRDDVEARGYDLILECTGGDDVILAAAEVLASRGIMVWLGSSRTPTTRPHNFDQFVRNGLLRNQVFVGSVNAAPRDFADALAHLGQLQRTHATGLKAVFTDYVSLDDALWHYQHRQPQGIKVVIRYDTATTLAN